jgi:hypothetical protein
MFITRMKLSRGKFIYMLFVCCILSVGCVKNTSSHDQKKNTTASIGNKAASAIRAKSDLESWLTGIWKKGGNTYLGGTDHSFSWGKSKMDPTGLVIDLMAPAPVLLSNGAQLAVSDITNNGYNFTFSLIDNTGHEKETISLRVQSDGTLVFPDMSQKTVLLIDFGKTYYKVDGPVLKWEP